MVQRNQIWKREVKVPLLIYLAGQGLKDSRLTEEANADLNADSG